MQTIKGGLERLEDVYNYPLGNRNNCSVGPERFPAKLTSRIELSDIKFGYSILEAPLLDGIAISIQPGSRVALVGASGRSLRAQMRQANTLGARYALILGRTELESETVTPRDLTNASQEQISLTEAIKRLRQ